MKVYVAASSNDRIAAREAMVKLAESGIEITLDWSMSEGYNRTFSEEENAAQAFWDLQAVGRADLVWIMLSSEKSEGAHAELGAALMVGKIVVVSGPVTEPRRIFPLLAMGRFDSHDDAMAHIILCHERRKAYGHD